MDFQSLFLPNDFLNAGKAHILKYVFRKSEGATNVKATRR